VNFHQFNIDDVRTGVRGWGVAGERLFYRMVGFVNSCRKCFVCAKVVARDYAEHIEQHDRKWDAGIARELEDEKYLIPVDPLLAILEEGRRGACWKPMN
jgi:hypothetical protein